MWFRGLGGESRLDFRMILKAADRLIEISSIFVGLSKGKFDLILEKLTVVVVVVVCSIAVKFKSTAVRLKDLER
jgi:hypothetical protein